MNRIVAVVAAVLILAGAGYFIFMQGPGDGDRVTGETLRSYVEQELTDAGATFQSVTYDDGSDTVTVAELDAPNVIPFYQSFKIAKFEIKGGDKRAFEMIIDEVKAKEAEGGDFMRLAKEMRAEGVTFTVDAASIAKAAAASSGQETSELEAEIDKAVGAATVKGSFDSFFVKNYAVKGTGKSVVAMMTLPDLSSPEAFNGFMAEAGKFAAAQKFDRYEVTGIKYSLNAEEVSIQATVDSIGSDGYDAGVLGKAEVGNTLITVAGDAIQEELGGPITVSMDSAIVERMDISDMLVAMQDGKLIPENPEKAPMLSPWAPVVGDYDVSGVKVSVPGMGDFTMEKLYAEDVKNVAGLSLGGKGGIKNLVIPGAALKDTGAKPVMDALGAEELRINGTADATFDEKKHIWDVSEFVIDVEKFGALDIQFRFGGMGFLNDLVGMPADEFASSGMMNRVLQEMTFDRLQLSYRDHGAVDYMLNMMAQQSGMERSQLVQQYVQQYDAMRAQFGEVEALNDLSKALATFLQEPKSITLTFEPDKPVPLGQLSAVGMAAPAQLVETLGFSVQANQ